MVYRVLKLLQQQVTRVVEGECRGADLAGKAAAEKLGIPVSPYPADWSAGRVAGMIRNTKMLLRGKPDQVWAFHDNIKDSRGTKDMMLQALRKKLPVYLVNHRGVWLFDRVGEFYQYLDGQT